MDLKNKISIILPTLNEKNNIEKIFFGIKSDFNYDNYEVIFVDDDSTDGTQNQIEKLSKNNNNVKYIFRKNDKDISRSFIDGVKKSNAKKVILMDSDLQHDSKDLNLFIPYIDKGNFDLINGSRFLENSNINGSKLYLLFRISLSKIFIFLSKNLFNIKLTDPLSGFFMAEREIILKYENKLYKNGWKVMLDFYMATKNDINFLELPINIKRRMYGASKLNIRVVINFCKLLIFHYFSK